MATPTVASSTPADQATSIPINQLISVIFSSTIDVTTANQSTVILYETESLNQIQGAVSLSANLLTVRFLPDQELRQNLSYTLLLMGQSDSTTGDYLKSVAGDGLVLTTSITFKTKTERFVSLTEITSRSDIERVGPIREESEL